MSAPKLRRAAATRATESISQQFLDPFPLITGKMKERRPRQAIGVASESKASSAAKGGILKKGKKREVTPASPTLSDPRLLDNLDHDQEPFLSTAGFTPYPKRRLTTRDLAAIPAPVFAEDIDPVPSSNAAVTIPNTAAGPSTLPPLPPRKRPRTGWVTTSPLTPQSSDRSDPKYPDTDVFLSAPASPIVFPAASMLPPAVHGSAHPQIPLPTRSSQSWWAELSPQPLSSPLSDTRSLPDTYPPLDNLPAETRTRSSASSDSLSSMRWSPRSIVSPNATDDGRNPSNRPSSTPHTPDLSSSPKPQSPEKCKPNVIPIPISGSNIPRVTQFKPRSQAFHRFSPIPDSSTDQSLAGADAIDVKPKDVEKEEMLEEIRENWEDLRLAFGRMERVMAKLQANSGYLGQLGDIMGSGG